MWRLCDLHPGPQLSFKVGVDSAEPHLGSQASNDEAVIRDAARSFHDYY
jgi:hypothetical protein